LALGRLRRRPDRLAPLGPRNNSLRIFPPADAVAFAFQARFPVFFLP